MADVVICAAQSVTRAGLAAMATTATTEVIGQVDSGRSLSHWLQAQTADLVIVELASVDVDNTATILNLVETLPGEERISVLCLIEDIREDYEQSLFSQLLATGLVSLIPIDVSTGGVRSAIAAILSGFVILYPDVTEALFTQADSAFATHKSNDIEPLTLREIEVLNQLSNGSTNKAIAQTLNISEHTVKFHISAILSKLGVSSRTEAVAVGIRSGLVML